MQFFFVPEQKHWVVTSYLDGEVRLYDSCFTLGSPLERLRFLLGLAITSRLCIIMYTSSSACSAEQLQLPYPCVLVGVARAAWLWRQCTEGGRGRKAEYTQQRYLNRLIQLKFSTVHVTASRVVYRFCL